MADKPSKSKAKKSPPPKTEAPEAPQAEDAAAPEDASQEAAMPPLMVLAQFIRDLSFENPSAPAHAIDNDSPPHVSINVNVNAVALSDNEYDVSLTMEAEAKNGDTTVFLAELVYGGLFRLNNLPPEHVQPVLMIECPRLLFPFARNILADVTRDGGFPPLLVQPIDFVALYQQQQAEIAGEAPQA